MDVALTLITALRIQEMSIGPVGGNVHHKLYSEKWPRHQIELTLILTDTHTKVDPLSLAILFIEISTIEKR